jgi:rhodanese-related sulfurtransferase
MTHEDVCSSAARKKAAARRWRERGGDAGAVVRKGWMP